MSSTTDWFECPKCGEQASREQDNRTCEIIYGCSSCDWQGEQPVNESEDVMAITDANGNKLPQDRINKKIFARNVRERRIKQGQDMNPAYCNECGYRVRSENHQIGKHHRAVQNDK